ncbi:hypothetical protein [Streptomyces sp. NPDC046727]|uniref:hypothetical protein n=1 Tax=Streptomyces sp. NPDC046727 TaxID=3155373 RepID=UPI0033F25747
MRKFLGPLLRTTAGALAFTPRHHAMRHHGFVRAADTSPDRRAPERGSRCREVRSSAGEPLTLSTGPRRTPGVPHSMISKPGSVPARRVPAHADTLGHGPDVPDLGPALLQSGDQQGFRLVSHADAAGAGALFAAVDARS